MKPYSCEGRLPRTESLISNHFHEWTLQNSPGQTFLDHPHHKIKLSLVFQENMAESKNSSGWKRHSRASGSNSSPTASLCLLLLGLSSGTPRRCQALCMPVHSWPPSKPPAPTKYSPMGSSRVGRAVMEMSPPQPLGGSACSELGSLTSRPLPCTKHYLPLHSIRSQHPLASTGARFPPLRATYFCSSCCDQND